MLHILQWLTYSLRPLSLDEVAEVVAFDVDSDDKFNDENRLVDPKDVLNMCSSLVISIETDSDDDEVANIESNSSFINQQSSINLASFQSTMASEAENVLPKPVQGLDRLYIEYRKILDTSTRLLSFRGGTSLTQSNFNLMNIKIVDAASSDFWILLMHKRKTAY